MDCYAFNYLPKIDIQKRMRRFEISPAIDRPQISNIE